MVWGFIGRVRMRCCDYREGCDDGCYRSVASCNSLQYLSYTASKSFGILHYTESHKTSRLRVERMNS
jgi:hypothetical protein